MTASPTPPSPSRPPAAPMPLSRKLLVALPVLVFAGLVAVFVSQLKPKDPNAVPSALLGKPAPEFSLPGYDAEHPGLATADLRQGTVTVVNIFASWCAPCVAELPQLQRLAEDHGVVVHAIAWKDKPDDMAAVFARAGNPFRRIGMDNEGRTVIDWGIAGVPETFIVDGRGTIIHRHIGDIRPEQVARIAEIVRTGKP